MFRYHNDLTLSTEMIERQPDDPVVNDLVALFSKLKDSIMLHNFKNTLSLFKNKETKLIIQNIDEVLTKRFGITFKHVAVSNNNYGVLTVPPKNFNILNPNIDESYKAAQSILKTVGRDPENIKQTGEIKGEDNDGVDIIYRWKEAIDNLEKSLSVDKVEVSLKEAKIKGLPKDYVLFLAGDIYSLLYKMKLTPLEMTAITLHEIGHGFSHIEYSYLTVRNTSVLLDNVRDNILKKNMSYKKSLILSYKKVTGESLDELKNKDAVTATIIVVNKFIKKYNYMSTTRHSYTDNEQLADQFAGKFGLSHEIGTAVEKIRKYVQDDQFDTFFLRITIYLAIELILGLILLGTWTGSLVGVGAMVFTVLLLTFLGELVTAIATSGDTTAENTYDDYKRRLIRLRNELVRQLKDINLPKKDKISIINNIEGMDKLLKNIPDDKVGILDNFIRKYTFNGRLNTEKLLTEQLLEDLDANNLHVLAAKLNVMEK